MFPRIGRQGSVFHDTTSLTSEPSTTSKFNDRLDVGGITKVLRYVVASLELHTVNADDVRLSTAGSHSKVCGRASLPPQHA
jgi:hypothetical protein